MVRQRLFGVNGNRMDATTRAIQGRKGRRMSDTISRQAAIDALNGIINRFEQILRDIRESKVDDSVCGMCEYDGAFVGQSGDWCNECPGFEKDDCFRLSDECRKRWLESVELPAAQPDVPDTNVGDLISRQAAIDAANKLVDRFEQILRDIRETNEDESVCGLCEYDGAFIGQSGDWCNECPGFDKDDCFKLSDECRKGWLESVELPAAQPEKRTGADEEVT